ncbi:MAG TPA: hypothetical protein VLG11_04205 [Candidatus Saccharimonadales bacterium]|nr:hypothetical protein [Candidatus Saccharimonadales bacterium]
MEKLLSVLRHNYPELHFKPGARCYWSPQHNTIFYGSDGSVSEAWGLLHELGHALLGHNDYRNDLDLLQKEILAWEEAKSLGEKYGVSIDASYVEDCLDTYRDWLHKRSTCPRCGIKALANDEYSYGCFNCGTTWHVSPARHRRPYRLTKKLPHKA